LRKRIIHQAKTGLIRKEHDAMIIIQASDGTDNSIPTTIWFLLNGVAGIRTQLQV
jgi:hypothetical protein